MNITTISPRSREQKSSPAIIGEIASGKPNFKNLHLPPLNTHTPFVACASLLPHLHHAGKSLDARLTAPYHGHLLVSTNIWPGHEKHIVYITKWQKLGGKNLFFWWLSVNSALFVFFCLCVGRWLCWGVDNSYIYMFYMFICFSITHYHRLLLLSLDKQPHFNCYNVNLQNKVQVYCFALM